MGAGSLIGQVHQHHIVQELAVDLAAEFSGVDLDRAHRYTFAIKNVHAQHGFTFKFELLLGSSAPTNWQIPYQPGLKAGSKGDPIKPALILLYPSQASRATGRNEFIDGKRAKLRA